MRRDQDFVSIRNHADVMVLAHEDDDEMDKHPYWYARVIGIFHASVRYLGEDSLCREFKDIEFIWVRWFGRDPTMPGGFAARRLHCVGFVDAESGGAFGFLDPSLIIRAVHLIPAYHYGRTKELLKGISMAREYDADPDDRNAEEDWQYYYVNMFVDRDMFMRYLGGGVGHKAFRAVVSIRDALAALTGIASKSTKADADQTVDGDDSDADSQAEEPRNDDVHCDENSENDSESEGEADSEPEDEEELEEFGYNEDTDDDEEGKDDKGNRQYTQVYVGDEDDFADGVGIDLGPDDGEDEDAVDEYGELGFARP